MGDKTKASGGPRLHLLPTFMTFYYLRLSPCRLVAFVCFISYSCILISVVFLSFIFWCWPFLSWRAKAIQSQMRIRIRSPNRMHVHYVVFGLSYISERPDHRRILALRFHPLIKARSLHLYANVRDILRGRFRIRKLRAKATFKVQCWSFSFSLFFAIRNKLIASSESKHFNHRATPWRGKSHNKEKRLYGHITCRRVMQKIN